MSTSAWDRLSDFMTSTATFVDFLRVAMCWAVLLALVVWLGAWFLKVFFQASGPGPGLAVGESTQSPMRRQLDEMANLAISRRPRTRKHRRRHHHNAHLASPKA